MRPLAAYTLSSLFSLLMLTGCVDVDQQAQINSAGRFSFDATLTFDEKLSKLAGDNPPPICDNKSNQDEPRPPFASRRISATKEGQTWSCHVQFVIADIRGINGPINVDHKLSENGPFSITPVSAGGFHVAVELPRHTSKIASNEDAGKMNATFSNLTRTVFEQHHYTLKISAPRIAATNGTTDGTTAEWNYSMADVMDDQSALPENLFADIYLDGPWYWKAWDWMLSSPFG